MASIARPALLRQGCNAAASKQVAMMHSPVSSAFASKTPFARSSITSRLIKAGLPGSSRVAAFHATGKRDILPPPLQRIQGTANDPVPVPEPSPSHGSYHWTAERLISAAIIPLTIAPFASGSLHPVTDAVFGSLLIAHSHIGFQACIIDYFPTKRVPGVRKASMWTLNLFTALCLLGLYELETNDVGLTETVKRVWKA